MSFDFKEWILEPVPNRLRFWEKKCPHCGHRTLKEHNACPDCRYIYNQAAIDEINRESLLKSACAGMRSRSS